METPSKTIERVREALERSGAVAIAYVFGSAARSGAGGQPPRDLDLAVVFRPGTNDPFRTALALNCKVEKATGVNTDLHEFDRLPVALRFRILCEGKVLLEDDPLARLRLEARTMLEYYDFKPYLDRIRAGTLARIAGSPRR